MSISCFAKGIKIAVPEIPHAIYMEDGKVNGRLVECLKNNGNVPVQLAMMPWARAIYEVKHGRFDAIMPAIKTEEREQFLTFPNKPLVKTEVNGLVKLKSEPFSDKNIHIIGKLRSSPLVENVISVLPDFGVKQYELFESVDFDSLVRMLVEGNIDYIIGNLYIIKQSADRLERMDQLDFLSIADTVQLTYLAFSKKLFSQQNADLIMEQINCPVINM